MKVKTSGLTGPALDWAVALAVCPEEFKDAFLPNDTLPAWARGFLGKGPPSSDWSQGGPLIGEYCTSLIKIDDRKWRANSGNHLVEGNTPLIAAMLAIVSSELGYEVEVPDELLT